MFPPKIKDLLTELRQQTEDENLDWVYDDDLAMVATRYKSNAIQVKYTFNENKEIGEFLVKVINKAGKEYFFAADQESPNDYTLARKLYDLAQSSDLDIDLG